MFHVLTITYLQPPDVIAEVWPAHLEWVEAHVDAGDLMLAGRVESGDGGILITSDIRCRGGGGDDGNRPLRGGGAGPLRPHQLQRRTPRRGPLTWE